MIVPKTTHGNRHLGTGLSVGRGWGAAPRLGRRPLLLSIAVILASSFPTTAAPDLEASLLQAEEVEEHYRALPKYAWPRTTS